MKQTKQLRPLVWTIQIRCHCTSNFDSARWWNL